MKVLSEYRPAVYQCFQKLSEEIDSAPSLTAKVKELIKLSTCTTAGSLFGVGMHVRQAMNLGASEAEILDTIICCLPVCGIANVNQALEAANGVLLASKKVQN